MRRWWWLLLTVPVFAQNLHSVAFTWSSNATGYTNCTTGTYCLVGFTLYDVTSGTPEVVGIFPESSTGYTMPYLPSVGTHIYELAQNSLDGQGNPQQTTGNPGIVVNCWKTSKTTRVCKFGKVWK